MKEYPTTDYPVAVWRQEREEPPPAAALYAGIFVVALNRVVDISFVPDVTEAAPPWNVHMLPDDLDGIETAEQARLATALLSSYVVTPNEALAGSEEAVVRPAEPGPPRPVAVFYVTPAEFTRHVADLAELTSVAGGLHPDRRVSELRGYGVVGLVENRVVASRSLAHRHAMLLGQA